MRIPWSLNRTGQAGRACRVPLVLRTRAPGGWSRGGDVGAGVSGIVAGIDCEHVIGGHVVTDPLTAANVATFLPGMADGIDENDSVDKLILDRRDAFTREGSGYLAIQNSRPQTIGYGLVDSPLLATFKGLRPQLALAGDRLR